MYKLSMNLYVSYADAVLRITSTIGIFVLLISCSSSEREARSPDRVLPHIQQTEPAAETIPTSALYTCVRIEEGKKIATPIMFEADVERLCRNHPEMGPCRYERKTCRQRGGKVLLANGTEITLRTEEEYDQKVMRFNLKTN